MNYADAFRVVLVIACVAAGYYFLFPAVRSNEPFPDRIEYYPYDVSKNDPSIIRSNYQSSISRGLIFIYLKDEATDKEKEAVFGVLAATQGVSYIEYTSAEAILEERRGSPEVESYVRDYGANPFSDSIMVELDGAILSAVKVNEQIASLQAQYPQLIKEVSVQEY